jgi:hypothetical protein
MLIMGGKCTKEYISLQHQQLLQKEVIQQFSETKYYKGVFWAKNALRLTS